MNEETENVVEEPEIIEEPEVIEEPEPLDPDFTGYKVVIYDRGAETPSWQVLLDTSSGENLGIIKASVENKLNEAGSFSYSIVPTHPLYDMTSPMRVYVSVMEGPVEIFYGRILSVQTNPLTKIKAVTCEGALAFLLDAELPIDTEDREMTAANYFKYCLNQYNSAIKINNNTYDELRRLRVGVIDVDDASETYPYKNSSYTQIQSVMKNQLLNTHDGFFKIRRTIGSSTDTYYHYLDWKKLSGAYKSTVLYEGTNIIDQTNTASGEDLFTIIRPVGNNDLTLSGDDELMNVSSSMVAKYGKIIRSVNFDADNESDLKSKAIKYRNKIKNRLSITGDISFVDFCFLLGSDTGLSLHVGDIIPTLQEYGIDNAIVESLTRDLLDPGKDKLSLKSDKDLMRSERASGANGSNNSGVKASAKISSGGGSRGGGGGGPSQYIKSATLSTDGKTLTLTPNHGTPIDFSKATTLEGAWSSGTLTVSAYQTNKGIKSNVGEFVSDHLLALARGGSEISEAFRAELRTVDTGEDVIYPNLRISKDIYLHENVSGTNSNVVAGGNADGSNPVASISVRSTYYAGKASVELNDPTWDPATTTSGTYVESNTAKVRTSGRTSGSGAAQEQEKEVKVFLTKGTTWTNNKLTVFLHSGTIDGPVQAATEVDASSIRYAGKASVELTDPSWNPTSNPIPSSQKITVQTVNRTDASGHSEEITKEALVFLTQGTWSNNKLKVYLKSGSTEGTTRAETEVDASSLVSDATTAGINTGKTSVTLTDPTWNPVQSSSYPTSNTVTVRTSGRAHGTVQEAEVTSSVYMVNGTTWTNNKLKVFLHLGSEGGTVLAATEVDASSIRYAGKASVELTDPAWNPTGATYPESQTITVHTENRTDLSGNPDEITKEALVFLTQGTWSNNKLMVYLKSGSAQGTIRAATEVDASDLVSDATTAGINTGKASVSLNDLTWTPTSSPLPESQTITARTTGRATSTLQEIEKTLSLSLAKGTTWTDNKLTVTLKAGSGSTPIAATEVDASDLVSTTETAARRAGKYSVTLTDPAWNPTGSTYPESQKITVNTVNRTDLSGNPDEITKETSVFLTQGTWSDTRLTVYLKSESAEGTIRAATTIDASTLVLNARRAGKASVGLNDLTWTPTSNPLPESQTITAQTNNRTTSSGSPADIVKQLSLNLVKGTTWSDNKLTVTLKAGSGSTPIAATEVDASDLVSDATSTGRAEYKALVRTRFGSSQSGQSASYFIEGYENTSGYASISGSSTAYKLGITGEKASSVVKLLTTADGTIANTPTLNVGSLYILGQNDLKDAGGAVGPIESNGTRTLNQYVTTLSVEVPSSAGYRGLEVGKSSESLAFYNRIVASTTETTTSISVGLNTGSVSTGSGVRTVRVYLGGRAGPYAEIYDYRDGKAAERANIKSRFINDGTNYCIEGYDSSSIEASRTVFTLGVKSSAVRILNESGNIISGTPYYSLSNSTYYESGYEAGHSDGWNEGGQTADVAVSTSISSLPSGETSDSTLNAWGKYVRVRPKYTNSAGTEVTITTAEKSRYYKIPELSSKKYTSNGTKTVNAPVSTIEIAVAANIDIDSGSIKWYDSSASPPSYDASLNTMGSKIQKGKLGYIYFTVTAADDSKVYRVPIDTR